MKDILINAAFGATISAIVGAIISSISIFINSFYKKIDQKKMILSAYTARLNAIICFFHQKRFEMVDYASSMDRLVLKDKESIAFINLNEIDLGFVAKYNRLLYEEIIFLEGRIKRYYENIEVYLEDYKQGNKSSIIHNPELARNIDYIIFELKHCLEKIDSYSLARYRLKLLATADQNQLNEIFNALVFKDYYSYGTHNYKKEEIPMCDDYKNRSGNKKDELFEKFKHMETIPSWLHPFQKVKFSITNCFIYEKYVKL